MIFFLPDPIAALHAYHRALKPGGRLALSAFDSRGDDRWTPVMGQVWQFVRDRPKPEEQPVGTPEKLDAAMLAAGFDEPRVTVEEHVSRFRDPEHYWLWAWSGGNRIGLELIPADRQERSRPRSCRPWTASAA